MDDWGPSRTLDSFETDKSADAKRVAIESHSLYGKATFVTMAYDARFAVAFISSSGAGGMKLHHRNFGELAENVTASNEYHRKAGNYIKYVGPLQRKDMPVDSMSWLRCVLHGRSSLALGRRMAKAGRTPRARSWQAVGL